MMAHPKVLGLFEVTDWRSLCPGTLVGEGRDTTLNRPVRLVRLEPGATDSARDEFLTAARRLAGGRHPSLATVLDVVEDGGDPYLVLESVSGGTLREWLAFFPPSQVEALRLVRAVVEGLVAARNLQLTTEDLHVHSIWVDRVQLATSATGPRVCLFQFRPLESVDAGANEAELLRGIGRVLFAILAGGRELDAEQPQQIKSIAPHVSKGVARFVEQLLDGGRGLTLTAAVRRIARLERNDQLRPLIWLATGVLIGIVMVSALLGQIETRHEGMPAHNVPPHNVPVLALAESEAAASEPESENPTIVDTKVRTEPLPPLDSIPEFEPLSPGWREFVVSLPPNRQVQAVVVELRRRNSGFEGEVHEVDIREGHIRGFAIPTEHIRDITPLSVLKHLEWITLPGKNHRSGQLESLRPLQKLQLRELRAGWTRIRDLTPLAGMPLKILRVGGTRVNDLTPLKGLPLEELEIWSTSVRDLAPLRDLKQLRMLRISGILATDLTPLEQLPLARLECMNLHVKDWSPLGKLPLQSLEIDLNSTDLRVILQGIRSLEKLNGMPVEEVLGTKTK